MLFYKIMEFDGLEQHTATPEITLTLMFLFTIANTHLYEPSLA